MNGSRSPRKGPWSVPLVGLMFALLVITGCGDSRAFKHAVRLEDQNRLVDAYFALQSLSKEYPTSKLAEPAIKRARGILQSLARRHIKNLTGFDELLLASIDLPSLEQRLSRELTEEARLQRGLIFAALQRYIGQKDKDVMPERLDDLVGIRQPLFDEVPKITLMVAGWAGNGGNSVKIYRNPEFKKMSDDERGNYIDNANKHLPSVADNSTTWLYEPSTGGIAINCTSSAPDGKRYCDW